MHIMKDLQFTLQKYASANSKRSPKCHQISELQTNASKNVGHDSTVFLDIYFVRFLNIFFKKTLPRHKTACMQLTSPYTNHP
jgi:hypothetical protein